jgi:hypothetical protein
MIMPNVKAQQMVKASTTTELTMTTSRRARNLAIRAAEDS